MDVHAAVGEQLLRRVFANVLRDAKQNVRGQRHLDLRQLYVVRLFKVRIQRGKCARPTRTQPAKWYTNPRLGRVAFFDSRDLRKKKKRKEIRLRNFINRTVETTWFFLPLFIIGETPSVINHNVRESLGSHRSHYYCSRNVNELREYVFFEKPNKPKTRSQVSGARSGGGGREKWEPFFTAATVPTATIPFRLQFNILPAYHTCPNIGDCPENRIYYDGCCERCNVTDVIPKDDRSLCAPETVPVNQTIGLVTEDSPFHDACANAEPIVGFAECRGLCDSYTYFNKSE